MAVPVHHPEHAKVKFRPAGGVHGAAVLLNERAACRGWAVTWVGGQGDGDGRPAGMGRGTGGQRDEGHGLVGSVTGLMLLKW